MSIVKDAAGDAFKGILTIIFFVIFLGIVVCGAYILLSKVDWIEFIAGLIRRVIDRG